MTAAVRFRLLQTSAVLFVFLRRTLHRSVSPVAICHSSFLFFFFCLVITETENSSVESVSRSIASHVHSRIERCVSARAGACTWQGYRSGYFSEGTWKTCNWLQSLPFRTAHAGGHLSPITDIVLIPSRIYSVPRLTLI